ncbi:MAG: TonB family protein [Chlorobium limicola]|uniref:TonB family protein n=1 Tax=Chlorobium limicola (strain DSM 245 / NBRC 103803 / 6330) TaxID=290315 RepID=B3EFN0_CHLL2|nr:energy transducer TonB [Chlorobium limicola]ACD90992.1 TonB family protein [Chlorobium limicola DSM 245]NTV07018.1 TonB family protein [Chlorobium limicola]NTV20772.1 TonB family protein [Chlorobium limicola]
MSSKFDNIHREASEKAAMWSFVEEFLDTDRLRKIDYGNLALRRKAHLFLSHGVITAIVLLGLFWLVTANWHSILSLAGFAGKDDEPMVECYEVVTSVTQLPPPPPLAAPEPSVVRPASVVPTIPNVGKIKSVKESNVPAEQTLATQKEIKQATQSQAPGTGSGGSGGASASDDVPMFVPCEKMPGFLDQKKPAYPEMARTAGIEGKVFVSVLIGEDGRPIKAKVMKRLPADCNVFDAVAIKSVMESKYYPGIQNGSPIKVWFTVPIRFQLD